MPVFYFHIRLGEHLAPDEEGLRLPGIGAALTEAVRSARSVAAEMALQGEKPDEAVIEIADEAGTVLDRVPIKFARFIQ